MKCGVDGTSLLLVHVISVSLVEAPGYGRPVYEARWWEHRGHAEVWVISHSALESTSKMQSRSCAVAKHHEPSRHGQRLPFHYLPAVLGITGSWSPNKAIRCDSGMNSRNTAGLFCPCWCMDGRRHCSSQKSHDGGSKCPHMSPVFSQNCRPLFLCFLNFFFFFFPKATLLVKSCSRLNHRSFAMDFYGARISLYVFFFFSTWAQVGFRKMQLWLAQPSCVVSRSGVNRAVAKCGT